MNSKLLIALVLPLAIHLIVQQATVFGASRWSSASLFQSDAISEATSKFMKSMNNDDPRTQSGIIFNDCGHPSDTVTIESFEVNPDPPVPGKKITVTASGTVHQTIEEGAYANVVVKLGLIKLLTKQFDICEELTKANATLQCPIEPGYYKIVQEVQLPREIPPAKFLVQALAYTQDDEDMACAKITADFQRS